MSIVFYISGHGFGHASRDVEVINVLGALGVLGAQATHRLVLRTAVNPGLLTRTLRVPYALIPGACDTGIVQATSIVHDDPATVAAALDFYGTYEARIAAELRVLSDHAVDLIVGDIPPLAFAVASRLGVPSVALGNFTWDWIYETHPGFLPDGAGAIDLIRKSYAQATQALELPFAGGFEVFPRVHPLPLIARRPTQSRRDTREYFGLRQDARVALLSFGGYGLPELDLAALDCRNSWTTVTTDRVTTPDSSALPHVRAVVEGEFLSSRFRYEDLVAASDVVITKPGFGIIAECISTGTPMIYTSRGEFREYAVLVDALPLYVRSRFISHEDLFAGRWQEPLEAVMAQPQPPAQLAVTGAEEAALIIGRFAGLQA